jgi:hypothetical protein
VTSFVGNLLVALSSGILSGGIIATVLTFYLNRRLEAESLQRIQAAKLSELFAKWSKYNAKEKQILSPKELYDYYEELTRMSYELSLWLKDETLLIKIMKRLTLSQNSPQPKELLIEIRQLILGKKPKRLTANDIVHWYLRQD